MDDLMDQPPNGSGLTARPACGTTVGVVDVGSPGKGTIGWAIRVVGTDTQCTGKCLDDFIKHFACCIKNGGGCLGFEAPLFVPYGRSLDEILRQRCIDQGKAWSAAAGAMALASALGVLPHVMRGLRERLLEHEVSLIDIPSEGSKELLVFEALVSGDAKAESHVGDALRAVNEVLSHGFPVATDECAFSLVGAALLRTGWSDDPSLLRIPSRVVRPQAG